MWWSVWGFNIACSPGSRRLDPPFPAGDVFIADKVGNRGEDNSSRGFVEDVDGHLIHLN